jgi:hypothetical protein
MKSFKALSCALGILFFCNSLVATPGVSHSNTTHSTRAAVSSDTKRSVALAIAKRIGIENLAIFSGPAKQFIDELEEAPEVSLSDVAKTLTLEAGIPFLLRQNSYTQFALYPYLWWYKGARAATEELTIDSIKWVTLYATGRQELFDCSHSGYRCKASKLVTTVALDRALRSYIVKPCTDKFFGQE